MKTRILFVITILAIAISSCTEIEKFKQGQTDTEAIYQSENILSHPGTVYLKNGDILTVFSSQNKAATPAEVFAVRKNVKIPGWSDPDTLLHTTRDCLLPAISQFDNGIISLVLTQFDNGTSQGIYLLFSYDNGHHFTAPRKIFTKGFENVQTHSPIYELKNGILIWTLEGDDSTSHAAFILRSSDQGESWEDPVPISRGQKGNLLSPCLVLLPQTILCLFDSDRGYINETFSEDEGRTWQKSTPNAMYGKTPDCFLTNQGTLMTVFRDQWPEGISRCQSFNQGKTWENEKQIIPLAYGNYLKAYPLNENRGMAEYVVESESGCSIMHTIFPIEIPQSPGGLSANRTEATEIHLRWNAVPDAKYYIVYRKEGTVAAGVSFTTEYRLAKVAQNRFDDSNVTHELSYTYAVSAVIGQGPVIPESGMESDLSKPIVMPGSIQNEPETEESD